MPYSLEIKGRHETDMPAMNLLPGEIAEVVDSKRYTGMIVMRISADVLSLSNPLILLGDACPLMVRRLPRGSSVILTVE
jgi:hypothetical protein